MLFTCLVVNKLDQKIFVKEQSKTMTQIRVLEETRKSDCCATLQISLFLVYNWLLFPEEED